MMINSKNEYFKGHSWCFVFCIQPGSYWDKGPQHCHFWKANSLRGDSLWLHSKPANPLGHRGPKNKRN